MLCFCVKNYKDKNTGFFHTKLGDEKKTKSEAGEMTQWLKGLTAYVCKRSMFSSRPNIGWLTTISNSPVKGTFLPFVGICIQVVHIHIK